MLCSSLFSQIEEVDLGRDLPVQNIARIQCPRISDGGPQPTAIVYDVLGGQRTLSRED